MFKIYPTILTFIFVALTIKWAWIHACLGCYHLKVVLHLFLLFCYLNLPNLFWI